MPLWLEPAPLLADALHKEFYLDKRVPGVPCDIMLHVSNLMGFKKLGQPGYVQLSDAKVFYQRLHSRSHSC